MRGAVKAVDAWLDQAIGADRLGPGRRDHLLNEQLKAVRQITPATVLASLATSIIILIVTFGEPAFPLVFIWVMAVCGFLAYCYLRYRTCLLYTSRCV